MKKLFFAGALALASLQSCQNSDANINQEDQQHQTFSGKNTARSTGYSDDEIKFMQEAMSDINDDYLGNPNPASRTRILCHTPYNLSTGNACVEVGVYLFNVTWQDAPTMEIEYTGPNTHTYWPRNYQANLVNSCNCR